MPTKQRRNFNLWPETVEDVKKEVKEIVRTHGDIERIETLTEDGYLDETIYRHPAYRKNK